MTKEYRVPTFMWLRKKTKKDLRKIKKLWNLKSMGAATEKAAEILLKNDLLTIKENENGKE
jgi:hypothetical protein